MPEGKCKRHPSSLQRGTVNLSVGSAPTGGKGGLLTPGCPNKGRDLRDRGFMGHASVIKTSFCQNQEWSFHSSRANLHLHTCNIETTNMNYL